MQTKEPYIRLSVCISYGATGRNLQKKTDIQGIEIGGNEHIISQFADDTDTEFQRRKTKEIYGPFK